MKKSRNLRLATSFALASAWFGTHCGSGFAAGTQATSFWVKFGAWAFVLPIISGALMGLVAHWEWAFCQAFKTYDYKSFADKLFHPYEKVFGNIYVVLFLGIMVMGVSAVFAGAGSLLQTMFGIPYELGVVMIIAITVLLTIFGSKVLMNSAAILSIILIVVISIVTLTGIVARHDRLTEIAVSWETNFSVWDALWSAVLYGSFQSTILGSTVNIADNLKTRKDAKVSAVIGFVMNGLMMVAITYMLLGWYPGIEQEELPVLSALETLSTPFLKPLYSLMLLLAFITTAITCIGSILKRVEGYGAKRIPNLTLRRGLYSFLLIMLCFGISQFGLLTIISKGYSAIGYLGILFVVIPILFIAPRKIKKHSRVSDDTAMAERGEIGKAK